MAKKRKEVLLRDILEEKAEQLKDKTFLLFEDQKISFKDLNERSNRVANGLLDLGVQPGDGVGLMMPNTPEFLYTFFGTQKIGAYVVPINVALKGEGLSYIINHSDSKALVINHNYIDEYSSIRGGLNNIEHVIADTIEAPNNFQIPDGAASLSKIMNSSIESPSLEINPESLAIIMYTAGTTGLPKGVVMRYNKAVGGVPWSAFKMGGRAMVRRDDILYTCLPLFHANALFLTTIRGLCAEVNVVLSRRFSASRFWDETRRYGVTTFNSLGAMLSILMKQPEKENDSDNPVKMILSAACPASIWESFENRFNVKIFEAYASTDGGGFAVANYGNAPVGSMGKPVGCVAKIVDDDDNEVPVGEVGELIFKVVDKKARKVEYYKDEKASEAVIRDDWLHTGDLVYQDDGGFLYYVDRKRDAIRRRGENIATYGIEKIIGSHPKVLESAVFGVPSELGEDEVMVSVVLKPGETLKPEEFIDFCEEKMAYFMVPRYVDFVDSLPKSRVERIRKFELKECGVTPSTWDREKAGYELKNRPSKK